MEAKKKQSTENFIKDIRRKTRRLFSSEQKIMIAMEALRGELSPAEICRKYTITQSMFYKWNKEFMEAGKSGLQVILPEKPPVMKSQTCVKRTNGSRRW